MKKIIGLFAVIGVCLSAFGKDDWRVQMHKWLVMSQANPTCKARYTTGIYRPEMGSQPTWGMMTEGMFDWFSHEGEKIAPQLCVAPAADLSKVKYRILIAATPMRTETQTVQGSEVRTQTQPTQATVNARTTYQDGSSSTTTATVQGTETTTVVVPTQMSYSYSASSVYMYAYRVDVSGWHLIASDVVTYSRKGVSGSGDLAAAELGVGLRNAISASHDKHRADKLYKSAMEAVAADSL